MRKSKAPSFRAPNKIVEHNSSKIVNNQDKDKYTRSTESILNLLTEKKLPKEENFKNIEIEHTSATPPDCSEDIKEASISSTERVFNIVYGKQSKKKHKTWEGDGTLHIGTKFITAKDESGNVLGNIPISKVKELEEGTRIFVGSKEIELIDEVLGTVSAKRKADPVEPVLIKRPKGLGKSFQAPLAESEEFVLPEPTSEHQWNFSQGRSVVAVTIEPFLARKLRPHQKRGVSFLYECVMGFKDVAISGAILADEMGLGKTLQCIALLWTLLRKGPYGKPVVRRVLIVTPSSLTGNWAAEFLKWLGRERLIPYVIDANHKPQDRHPNDRVVIISYEMLQRHRISIGDDFDLLICDEAHRLKNSDTKASQALNELCISKRILLTGTPMQNDLHEYFVLVDFANPNSLGNYAAFRRYYEGPIVAARQPEATEETRALGEERAVELNQNTSKFVLRRTQSVLDSYLPGKKEIVVFCRASPLQQSIYNAVLDSLGGLDSSHDGAFHLGIISALRKVACHPALVLGETLPDENQDTVGARAAAVAKTQFSDKDLTLTEHSGKLMVVLHLLAALWKSLPRERVVLVSSFTRTLDMLEELCKIQKYPTLRLDGSTPSTQRTDIVARFNSDSNQFVFLLSAKAGGVGLNLVGASRLVLFDSDWNPATDLQAMGRIWRDGQRRQVYIYRLLTAETIEEKMFQRQLSKQTLAGGIVDTFSSSSVLLSRDELKDIFTPCQDVVGCLTHSSLGCQCDGSGLVAELSSCKENRPCQVIPSSAPATGALRMEELMSWEHHGPPVAEQTLNDFKLFECGEIITYIFCTSC